MTLAETSAGDVNWFAVLAHHATRTPDRAMTVFEGETTTYGEMARRAAALAGGLSERGVGPGQVVGLLSYNCPEFLETVFAANYLGAIAMPINWRLAAPEVRYILEHSGARALVCDARLIEHIGECRQLRRGARPVAQDSKRHRHPVVHARDRRLRNAGDERFGDACSCRHRPAAASSLGD